MQQTHWSNRLMLVLAISLSVIGCPASPGGSTLEEGSGQNGATADSGTANPKGEGSEIVEIAAGEGHTVVLTADGSVWTCGNGGDGQLGWEQTEMCFWGVRVEGLPVIRDVAAGNGYSVFLAEDGELWGAGYGSDGRLGPQVDGRVTTPVALGIGGLKDVAAMTNFTLGRRDDDSVVAFGVNDAGGLGSGSAADSAIPVETGVSAIVIDAGDGYSLALTEDGYVKSWGMNNYGTLGTSTVPTMSMGGAISGAAQGFFSLVPVEVEIEQVIAISAGIEHALAVRDDGSVWGWGRNINGSLAQPDNNVLYPVPVQIQGLSDIVEVAAGREFGLALTRSGEVLSWGLAASGRLGRTVNSTYSSEPAAVSGLPPVRHIVAGIDRGYAIDRDGNGWAWGMNEYGQLLADVEGLGPPARIVLGTP